MNGQELLHDQAFVETLSDALVEPLLHNSFTKDREGGQSSNHIVGFGVGFKSTQGMTTDKLALIVYVRHKLCLDDLAREEQIRERLFIHRENVHEVTEAVVYRKDTEYPNITGDGIPTDVQQIGQPEFDQLGTYTRTERPSIAGISVGWKDDATGTIGCFVRDKKSKQICILSAAHVFGRFHSSISGDIVIQPGVDDGGKETLLDPSGVRPQDYYRVAKVVRASNVQTSTTGAKNKVDAAIAVLDRQSEFRSRIEGNIGSPVRIGQAELQMLVHKTGRTTGYTIGRIESTQATFSLGLSGNSYDFTDLIATTVMSKPGDSGSLLLSVDGNKALGLLIGSSANRSFYCKFTNVASELDIELA